MAIPKLYQWLQQEAGPKMLLKGLELYGIKEVVGSLHNPIIMGWAKETGLEHQYTADEIPWCGLVHAVICKRSDKPIVKGPLWALNWANWEEGVSEPMLGDTLVFKRKQGGHVGLYVAEDEKAYHVMGGNQGNAYTISRIDKARMVAARRPIWKVSQPENIRKVYVDASGVLSTNEQ